MRRGEPFVALADHVALQLAVPIAGLELVASAAMQLAAPVDGLDALDDAPGLAAVAAGVHRQCAADGARNTGEALRAGVVLVGGEARQIRAVDPRLGEDLALVHARPVRRALHLESGGPPAFE